MTRVFTARVTYAGADRLDITRVSAGVDGIAFAPSWTLLGPMLSVRRRGQPIDPLWPAYKDGYLAEMRASYRRFSSSWDALLAREEVTLVCYCTDAAHCHRTLLAEILAKLGATPCGERAS